MNKSFAYVNLVIVLIAAVLLGLLFMFNIPDGNVGSRNLSVSDNWKYNGGASGNVRQDEDADPEKPVFDPVNTISMSRQIDRSTFKGADLCFTTNNITFKVYLDDELIYDFHPEIKWIYGKYYGDYIHVVHIPEFEGLRTLTIEYESLLRGEWTAFRGLHAESGASYVTGILQRNFWKFILSFSALFLGMMLVIFGIFQSKRPSKMTETIALGTMAIILALYTHAGTHVMFLVTGNSAIMRVIEHFCLVLMPAPAIIFFAAMTENLNSHLVKILLWLVTGNFIVCLLVLVFGITDFHNLLILSHAIIAIGIGFMVFMYVRELGLDKERDNRYRYMLLGFGVLFLTGIIDIIRYYIPGWTDDTAAATRIGLTIFCIVLLIYETTSLIETNKKSLESDIQARLARVDGLTGLSNRLAFNECEDVLQNGESGMCVIVQFDVNDLKKVNDKQGHLEGDRRILAASEAIKSTFGTFPGTWCFRTGGDEFMAIMTGPEAESHYQEALKLFEDYIDDYNTTEKPEIPLLIPCGMAVYESGSGASLIVAERLADDRMYERKTELKEKYSIV
ncbi:MAG: diguanylate cyclase [Clostridiales bacterium]|nr:diguanylate cyclase [Clostridiales bacterium]